MQDDFVITEDSGRLADAVFELAQELWVSTERNRILEELLQRHGLQPQDEVDRFEPDDSLSAELTAERRLFVKRLLASLTDEALASKPAAPDSPYDSFT